MGSVFSPSQMDWFVTFSRSDFMLFIRPVGCSGTLCHLSFYAPLADFRLALLRFVFSRDAYRHHRHPFRLVSLCTLSFIMSYISISNSLFP